MLQGRDHDEAHAPTMRAPTFRVMLVVTLTLGMLPSAIDLSNAFVNADIDKIIHLRLPQGHWLAPELRRCDPARHCLRLRKSLCGCVQAARLWFSLLVKHLVSLGFSQSRADPCPFLLRLGGSLALMLGLHVDDVAIASSSARLRASLVSELRRTFDLRDEGALRDFLGLRIDRTSSGLHLSQGHCVRKLLQRFRMTEADPMSTPMAPGVHFAQPSDLLDGPDVSTCRSLVGGLLFVAGMTRPDTAVALSKLCKHMAKPTRATLTAAKRVLRYLKHTATLGVTLRPAALTDGHCTLSAFCDASHGDSPKARSTAGFFHRLHSSVILWSARPQSFVAFSTTEAEYATACACLREGQWLLHLLGEMDMSVRTPAIVKNDNKGAIALAQADKSHHRTKTCRIHCHLVKQLVEEGLFRLEHVPSTDNPADASSKPLASSTFEKHRDALLSS